MKKLLNRPEDTVSEMIEGILIAYPNFYKRIEGENGLVYKDRSKDKVSIVIGGGSGHEPMFFGYLGKGIADGVAIGNVFTAPTPGNIYKTAIAVDNGKGVLLLYGNHSGDVLNFGAANELLVDDGHSIENVPVTDDVASAEILNKKERRGIAGIVLVLKIVGAAAELGYSLAECGRIARKVNESVCSLGVGLTPGINPITGKPNFEIADNKMEYGIGVHGEHGIEVCDMLTANGLAEKMIKDLDREMKFHENQEVIILVNGLGSLTMMEELLLVRKFNRELFLRGIHICDTMIGNYFTTSEMGGVSVSVLKVDDELKALYREKAYSPVFRIGGIS